MYIMFTMTYPLTTNLNLRNQTVTQPSSLLSFRVQGVRPVRPKGMYIDMNIGKGCHSCGKG
jgi:hypothetical protein